MEIIFQYLDKKQIYVIFFLKKKGIIYTNYNNWIFLHRFAKEIFFQEIWALGKIIYFIYKIIFFFLNLTEIKKFKFCFLKIIFQNSDEKKCVKLVETKKLHVCLKHIPHMTYTFNIYYIVLHYKEFFFQTYTRYSLYMM